MSVPNGVYPPNGCYITQLKCRTVPVASMQYLQTILKTEFSYIDSYGSHQSSP